MRILLALTLVGCIVQTGINQPVQPVAGGGTLSCRQIAEQCDTQCTNPLTLPNCVRACSSQGTPDAANVHNAVVDCAQRNNCIDQACVETRCAGEIGACQGPEQNNVQPEEPPPLAPAVE
jgi:hypothetical protein